MQAIIPTDSITLKRFYRAISLILAGLTLCSGPVYAAVNIPLTVNLSETVNITGTPRIAVDVGGTTRYATYTSGTGSNSLTFTLAPQAGDVDLDGVTVSSPIDLNGGTIKDVKGNNAALTFTPPSTTNIKVNYPSLGMDFVYDADGRYTLNGTVYNDLTSFLSAAGGTFTRASIGTYFDSTGTLQTAASGTPRFDYDPATHTPKGILIEESRTNTFINSETLSSGFSYFNQLNITDNTAVSPKGTTTASTVVATGTDPYLQKQITVVAGTTYTASIWIKGTGSSIGKTAEWWAWYFGTATGSNTYNTFTIPSSWTRVSVTFTPTGSGTMQIRLDPPAVATIGDTVNIFGVQLEQGAFATSYIPTTTAAVTRAADSFSIPTGAWFNNTNSSFTATAESFGMSSGKWPGIVDFYLSGTERFGSYYNASGISVISEQRSSGSTKMSSKSGSWGNVQVKASASFDTSGIHLSVNGTSPILSASGGFPSGLTTMRVGRFDDYLNGYLTTIKYYPSRVTDTQLQLLTQ